MIGQTLGHYRVLEQLGVGGIGVVYRAHDTQLDRDVALKALPSEALADDTARSRLLREARLTSKLSHPHICSVAEVGEAEGQDYIAMELVEGQPLNARLAAGSPVEPFEMREARLRAWPSGVRQPRRILHASSDSRPGRRYRPFVPSRRRGRNASRTGKC